MLAPIFASQSQAEQGKPVKGGQRSRGFGLRQAGIRDGSSRAPALLLPPVALAAA
ncbi:MAG: hypothetical protein ABSB61_13695 [Anaerolineales bacterium]